MEKIKRKYENLSVIRGCQYKGNERIDIWADGEDRGVFQEDRKRQKVPAKVKAIRALGSPPLECLKLSLSSSFSPPFSLQPSSGINI